MRVSWIAIRQAANALGTANVEFISTFGRFMDRLSLAGQYDNVGFACHVHVASER
jgi:hypothetical protein